MLITSASVHVVRIPFVAAFAHHLATHHHSRSLVVRLTLDSGATGHGEGAPRAYVTGEDEASGLAAITAGLRRLIGSTCAAPATGRLPVWVDSLLEERCPGLGQAAHCALASALLDALLRERGGSLAALIPATATPPPCSGVITAGTPDVVAGLARRCAALGLPHIKVKVGALADHGRVAQVRAIVGPAASLRVDANGAFDRDTALRFLDATAACRLDAIEQPLPRGAVTDLAELHARTAIPIVVDESLVTRQDAEELIAARACDLFNLRLSKCGGLGRTLDLAERATAAGLGLQLGCQVGETAILAALGRHTAAHLRGLRFVEGCFGTHLLATDLATTAVVFGPGGVAPDLPGPGSGITIDAAALDAASATILRLT